jgi:hypothetical protein
MTAVKKWAEDKPFLIAFIAPQIAASARDIHQLFEGLKEGRFWTLQFTIPEFHSWFELYRSPTSVYDFLIKLMNDFSTFGKDLVNFAGAKLQELGGMTNPDDIAKFFKNLIAPGMSDERLDDSNEMLKKSFIDVNEDLSGTPIDPDLKGKFLLFITGSIEAFFFLSVFVPCWLLYRTTPDQLYKKALKGNIDAIEKLLRLDPILIHEHSIGEQVQALRFSGEIDLFEKIIKSPANAPKGKTTREKQKMVFAGLISAMSIIIADLSRCLTESTEQPLTEPDIRALFDAVCQDSTNDPHAIDTDLPESPETFYKALYRERNIWLKMLKQDKK